MSDHTHKLIKENLDSIKKIYEDDTEQLSSNQLEPLRQINTSVTLKYIKKEDELKSIARKIDNISSINSEVSNLLHQLQSVEKKMDFVEALTGELDEFTRDW